MSWIFRACVLFALGCLVGCSGNKNPVFEDYAFEYKGYVWDTIPYQFSTTIEDIVLKEKGSQFAATDYANIGAYGHVLSTWDAEGGKRTPLTKVEIDEFRQYEPESAHAEIIKRAQETKVTIINEAHHIPQHRVFTTTLLQDMWDIGYRHIGLEAYFSSAKSDSSLVANGYPTLVSGYYIKEPQLGNLIRQALKVGFRVFGYESMGHDGPKERDINQATNIQNYMASHPKGKVLIHCGYAHGSEGIYGGGWEKTMAARLTDYMGIDPLTIDQTTYRERGSIDIENQYYQLADIKIPAVFINDNDVFGKYRDGAWFDLFVFHPRTQNFDRPEWLLYGDREMVNLSFEDEEINCPCLVLVYKQGEVIGSAVPYDIQETSVKSADLILDKKEGYNVIVLNEEGQALKTIVD